MISFYYRLILESSLSNCYHFPYSINARLELYSKWFEFFVFLIIICTSLYYRIYKESTKIRVPVDHISVEYAFGSFFIDIFPRNYQYFPFSSIRNSNTSSVSVLTSCPRQQRSFISGKSHYRRILSFPVFVFHRCYKEFLRWNFVCRMQNCIDQRERHNKLLACASWHQRRKNWILFCKCLTQVP